MRFKPTRRYPYEATSRKAVFLEKKLERGCPGLPQRVYEADAKAELDRRAVAFAAAEAADRKRKADAWVRVRRRFFAITGNIRPLLAAFWNEHRWYPADPGYLHSVLDRVERGDLTPDQMAASLENFRRLRALYQDR